MSDLPPEQRTFATTEAEAEEVSRHLHSQIARLRAEVEAARSRLSPTARERARDGASDKGPAA